MKKNFFYTSWNIWVWTLFSLFIHQLLSSLKSPYLLSCFSFMSTRLKVCFPLLELKKIQMATRQVAQILQWRRNLCRRVHRHRVTSPRNFCRRIRSKRRRRRPWKLKTRLPKYARNCPWSSESSSSMRCSSRRRSRPIRRGRRSSRK